MGLSGKILYMSTGGTTTAITFNTTEGDRPNIIVARIGSGSVHHWVDVKNLRTACGRDASTRQITEDTNPRDDPRYRTTCNSCDGAHRTRR